MHKIQFEKNSHKSMRTNCIIERFHFHVKYISVIEVQTFDGIGVGALRYLLNRWFLNANQLAFVWTQFAATKHQQTGKAKHILLFKCFKHQRPYVGSENIKNGEKTKR